MIELILVISIIAFLTVTATVVLSQWLSKSRDSRRMADIVQIEKGLETAFIENNEYPLPDSYVNITASGTLFNYQGKFCDTATEKSNIKATPKDPSDNACYTYETTTGQNKFQLMAMMENTDTKIGFNENGVIAVDYSKRIPSVKGDKLGILVASGTNQPVEDSGTGVDVMTTTNEYISYFTTNNIIQGTGKNLYLIGAKNESCNSILKTGQSKGDGIYSISINNNGIIDVYCDMTTNLGGRTSFFGSNNSKLFSMDLNKIPGGSNYGNLNSDIWSSNISGLIFNQILIKLKTNTGYINNVYNLITGNINFIPTQTSFNVTGIINNQTGCIFFIRYRTDYGAKNREVGINLPGNGAFDAICSNGIGVDINGNPVSRSTTLIYGNRAEFYIR